MSTHKDLDGCEYEDDFGDDDRAGLPIVLALALGIVVLWMVYSVGLCESRGYCGLGATAWWALDSWKGK